MDLPISSDRHSGPAGPENTRRGDWAVLSVWINMGLLCPVPSEGPGAASAEGARHGKADRLRRRLQRLVRTARLALEETGVDYALEDVDIFAEGGPPSEHLARHPFARIPPFEA